MNDPEYRASIQELFHFLTFKGKKSQNGKKWAPFTNSHRCWNFGFKTLSQETNITWTVQAQLRERWDTLGSCVLAFFTTSTPTLQLFQKSLHVVLWIKGSKYMEYEKYESIIWLHLPSVFFLSSSSLWTQHEACGTIDPWPESKSRTLAVKVWTPNHWATKDFPHLPFLSRDYVFEGYAASSLKLPNSNGFIEHEQKLEQGRTLFCFHLFSH